ncbi:hypothetical protein [Micromonospora tulbaghiae]|uniref:hypothetical protein n=1 Tax=Micromonospora tulbaghiae TaxID=479978 RepID=UPI00369E9244
MKVSTRSGAVQRDLTVAITHTYYVIAGDSPVLVHNCGGTEAGAQKLADRATELQEQVGYGGTTSVVRVRRIADPRTTEVWVANNKKYMPSGWKKGPNVGLKKGEVFVELEGHAEESILAALGNEWRSSRVVHRRESASRDVPRLSKSSQV